MSASPEQMVEVELLSRAVNERIAATAERLDSGWAAFYCECGDPACVRRVDVTLEEYEEVRAKSTHFLLVPGHEDLTVERILARQPRYAVVEKVARAVAAAARRLDPRRRKS